MTKNDIYVLGSINIDLVIKTNTFPLQGETVLGNEFSTNAGGKGANQAVQAAKLGSNVNFIGAVGNDEFRDKALEDILKSGINISNVSIKDTNTGVASIISYESDNRIILDPGANFQITEEDLIKGLNNARANDIFVTQFEVEEELVYKALEIAKEKGMITILNPAPAKKIDSNYYKLIDYLIVNQTETELLTNIYPNNMEDSIEAYNYFKKYGLKHLIVTLGSVGSAYIGDSIIDIKAHDFKVIDTTGAGDSYIGAFSYGLANNMSHEEALKLANATSALTCMKYGTQKVMPKIDEVNRFLKERGVVK